LFKSLIKTNITPAKNKLVKIILLYLASQLGKKISKLSFVESEYFLAIIVIGQRFLNINNTSPSKITNKIEIHVKTVILFANAQ